MIRNGGKSKHPSVKSRWKYQPLLEETCFHSFHFVHSLATQSAMIFAHRKKKRNEKQKTEKLQGSCFTTRSTTHGKQSFIYRYLCIEFWVNSMRSLDSQMIFDEKWMNEMVDTTMCQQTTDIHEKKREKNRIKLKYNLDSINLPKNEPTTGLMKWICEHFCLCF